MAYNNALLRSEFVCSDGVVVDGTPPVLANVRAEGVVIRPGLIKYVSTTTRMWLLTADGVKYPVSDLSCAVNATAVPSPDAFPDANFTALFETATPLQAPTNNTFSFEIQHGFSTLRASNSSNNVTTVGACAR